MFNTMQILLNYARIFAKRWWLIALPVVAMLAATLLTSRPAGGVSYQTVMRFSAGLPAEDNPNVFDYDRYYAWLTSEYAARGMGDVLRTGKFAEAVSARLKAGGADIPWQQIQGAITSDFKQSIVVVYLNWPQEAQIVPISNAIAQEITANTSAYWPQMDGKTAAMRQLDSPVPAAVAPPLRSRFDLPVQLLLALAAGLALAFAAYALDPFIRERGQIEHMGLPVLGSIPKE